MKVQTSPVFMVSHIRKGNRTTKPLWWAHVFEGGVRLVTGVGPDANSAITDAKRQLARLKAKKR